MSAAQQVPFINEQEYLVAERAATERSEYLDGLVVAMSGGSVNHARIIGNCFALLRQLLPDMCEAFASELRVQAKQARSFLYPDITVVCGPIQAIDNFLDTVTNPVLIIEVLSPSTASSDRGRKFHYYRSIDTMQQYALIEQMEPRIESWTRQADGHWQFLEANGLSSTLPVPSLQCELPLQKLYQRVVFPSGTLLSVNR